jgi:VIT1/CCC1 family predicted Fe2+/Mn2+ transporter
VLFAFGAYKAWRTVGRPLRGGLGRALVGTLSALVGFGVGALFRVPGG